MLFSLRSMLPIEKAGDGAHRDRLSAGAFALAIALPLIPSTAEFFEFARRPRPPRLIVGLAILYLIVNEIVSARSPASSIARGGTSGSGLRSRPLLSSQPAPRRASRTACRRYEKMRSRLAPDQREGDLLAGGRAVADSEHGRRSACPSSCRAERHV